MRYASLIVLFVVGCGGNNSGSGDMAGNMRGSGGNGGSSGTGGNGNIGGSVDMGGGSVNVGYVPDLATSGPRPIIIKNASLRGLGMSQYNLTFVVVDDLWVSNSTQHDILRVDLLRLSSGGNQATFNLSCPTSPWTDATPMTPVITGNLYFGSSQPTMYLACGAGDPSLMAMGSLDAPPAGGTLHVAIDGVLDDATPFTAEADAPVL